MHTLQCVVLNNYTSYTKHGKVVMNIAYKNYTAKLVNIFYLNYPYVDSSEWKQRQAKDIEKSIY